MDFMQAFYAATLFVAFCAVFSLGVILLSAWRTDGRNVWETFGTLAAYILIASIIVLVLCGLILLTGYISHIIGIFP